MRHIKDTLFVFLQNNLNHLKYTCFIIFLSLFAFKANVTLGQNTIGLIEYSSQSDEGYTLLSPTNSSKTYLIDNCGFIVNSWATQYRPGLMTYLLEDGTLLKTGRISNSFIAGGSSGRVEKLSWDNELLWAYNFSTDTDQSHHDIAPMPNGNFLVLLWDLHTEVELIENGRNPSLVPNIGNIWSEKIQEIKPIGTDSIEIVWEWNSWDHLVQDFDPTKANFGVVSEHPELYDINFPVGSNSPDWMHMNSIDYNPELDQISINSRNFNEFYIIDHSTTTEEAKTDSGGIYGQGGNILFRWGNPAAYKNGTASDQKLYGQHDASWIDQGLNGEGNILLFNNNYTTPEGITGSRVEEIVLKENNDGFYELNSDGNFGPETNTWNYPEEVSTLFHSRRISGAQRLSNGNTLICDGQTGTLLEVTQEDSIAWKYISPISFNGPLTQGNPPSGSDVFKVRRYPYEYPAFEGKDLTPTIPIENEPNPTDCMTMVNVSDILTEQTTFKISPNPFESQITLNLPEGQQFRVEIFNQVGQRVSYSQLSGPSILNTDFDNKGIYLIKILDIDNKSMQTHTMIKL